MSKPPAPHLLDLHTELQLEIVSHLKNTPTWQRDLLNWSSVSSNFRSLLAPYVFTQITLCNTEKSGASVDLIAKSNYRQYVRKLSFQGMAPGDEEEGFSDVDGIFPPVVESVLSDLSCFPALETVVIHFDLKFDRGWEEGFMLFQDLESPAQRLELEKTEAWRALNTKTYAALARNIKPGFKHLTLQNLLPLEASSFSTPEFRTLLSNMTKFDFSVWWDQTGHSAANTRLGYVDYTQKFDALFFNHLVSVTHLTISAAGLPMGLYGFHHGALKLNRFQMPLLKSLALESVFICPELREFLASRADTLESVQILESHAGSYHNDNPITWAELFTALSQANPAKLREFTVLPSDGMELFDDYHAAQADKDEALLTLEFMKRHPERRLFAYSYIDDKYGFVGCLQYSNLDSYRLGADQRAFDELMRIVETNCAKT